MARAVVENPQSCHRHRVQRCHCRRRGIDRVARFRDGGSGDLGGDGGKVGNMVGDNRMVGEGAERGVGCFNGFFYDEPIIKRCA